MIKKSIKLVMIAFGMLAITSSCSREEPIIPPSAEISNIPNSNDFGNLQVNTTSEKEFTIKNTGNAELEISSLVFDGENKNEFSTSGTAVNIAVGGTYSFNITFKPVSEGNKTSVLLINSNIGRYGINVTGKGI